MPRRLRRTPTAVLADAGAQHFTPCTPRISTTRTYLLVARARCCVCPTTERDLADGIGRRRLRRRLALARQRLHAVIDLFEEARGGARRAPRERRARPPRCRGPDAGCVRGWTCLPRLARRGPHRTRGARGPRDGLAHGRAAGRQLARVRARLGRFRGLGSRRPARTVDGREVVADGRHTSIDVAELHEGRVESHAERSSSTTSAFVTGEPSLGEGARPGAERRGRDRGRAGGRDTGRRGRG